jgi:DNA-binding beta-propeller fold protein YncE
MTLYQWTSDGFELPREPLGWMHSGVAVVDGSVVVAHPGEPTLLFHDDEGVVERSLKLEGLLEPHGFCATAGGLWIGDVGFKRHVRGPEFETVRGRGRVVLVDNMGRVLRELGDPASDWSPTAVAAVEETGDVWVADGYGQSLVHRFDSGGRHVQTLNGEEGAGRFNCPHGVLIDRRRDEAELYVSDRANARLQVFDLDGKFKRTVGEGVVVTPTDMAVVGEELALTDFTQARVTILDPDGQPIEHIGANPDAPKRPGWPNARDAAEDLVRPQLRPGRFNSPHTLAPDAAGNLYVTEWLLGGRVTKLTRIG